MKKSYYNQRTLTYTNLPNNIQYNNPKSLNNFVNGYSLNDLHNNNIHSFQELERNSREKKSERDISPSEKIEKINAIINKEIKNKTNNDKEKKIIITIITMIDFQVYIIM